MRGSDLIPALALALGLAGCAPITPDACTSDAQCVEAFGWGHVCDDEATCAAVQPTYACAAAWPEDLWTERDAHRNDLVIGALVDSERYPVERASMRLAVDQINDLGGIDGRDVALVECDVAALDNQDHADAIQGIGGYLTGSVGTPVTLGPIYSSDATALLEGTSELVAVSPSASGLLLDAARTEAAAQVWRMVPSDLNNAQSFVRDMLAEGLISLAIVHSRDDNQSSLAEQLVADLDLAGLRSETFDYGSETERNAQLVEAAYANTDAVALLSEDPDDYVEFVRSADTIGSLADRVLYVGSGAYREDFLTQTEGLAALDQVRGVRPAPREGAVADVFRASYSSAYDGASPDEGSFAAHSYDAAWMTFAAVSWSGMRYGALSATGVAEGLGSLSFGSPLSLGPSAWSDLTEVFAGAETVDLEGASSSVDIDLATRAVRAPVAVWIVGEEGFEDVREFSF
ncbi:MAG: ABC transporter substrate-binding protein [Deltaproteobacteria bacterium]|nr:ABC transporter substrate-binding protein [Deltaproteobacteria bacterium]